mmetsp:Transcript_29366/g.41568  ORF Transcript_29366/g.41568 Transcript_29366/m.41568 type:complete len:185 (-) Transcript_29366:177-731(-)
MSRIRQTERDQAQRLFRSAAGAALLSDVKQQQQQQQQQKRSNKEITNGSNNNNNNNTFETDMAVQVAVEFTKEQKGMIRHMIEHAKNPAELDEIEASVQRGVFPSRFMTKKEEDNGGGNDETITPTATETVAVKRKREEEEVSVDNEKGVENDGDAATITVKQEGEEHPPVVKKAKQEVPPASQ